MSNLCPSTVRTFSNFHTFVDARSPTDLWVCIVSSWSKHQSNSSSVSRAILWLSSSAIRDYNWWEFWLFLHTFLFSMRRIFCLRNLFSIRTLTDVHKLISTCRYGVVPIRCPCYLNLSHLDLLKHTAMFWEYKDGAKRAIMMLKLSSYTQVGI